MPTRSPRGIILSTVSLSGARDSAMGVQGGSDWACHRSREGDGAVGAWRNLGRQSVIAAGGRSRFGWRRRSARRPQRGLQERIEQTRLGRLVITIFLLATVAGTIVVNLPRSTLRTDALTVGGRYLNLTGLDQSWSLFAPDPRRRSIAIEARVQYADGTAGTWRLPHGGALIGNYWDYHWQKWLEFVLDVRHPELWRPAAVFIARESNLAGRRPVRVTLIRVTSLNEPPGRTPDHSPAIASAYYSLRITPPMLRGSSK